MKRVIAILTLTLVAAGMLAAPVGRDQAEQVAAFKLQLEERADLTITDSYELTSGRQTLGWVFNLDPIGFVAAPSDTDLPPVIFYSFENNFSTEDTHFNHGLQFLRDDIAKRMELSDQIDYAIKEQNHNEWQACLDNDFTYFSNRSRSIYPVPGSTPTGGWVSSTWNQSPNPYNTFCPYDTQLNERVVVGCVATAMGMILDYHRYIGDASFDNSDDYNSGYDPPFFYIDNDYNTYDFLSFPQLNAELDEVRALYETDDPLDSDGIAALGFASGVSVEMNYEVDGSGAMTEDVYTALLNKFDYESAFYRSYNSTFYDYLEDDMMHARPAEMGIRQSSTYAGHAIIVDGWNTSDDTFHLNMGWGGSSNGWYSLPDGMPSGYDIISGAVCGIEGGAVPHTVLGNVSMSSGSPIGAMITLEGVEGTSWNYEGMVGNANGDFSIDAVHSGVYLATCQLGARFWFDQHVVTIDDDNDMIFFTLGQYDAVTGTVTAPVSAEGAQIVVYDTDSVELMSGQIGADGTYSLPPLYPGDYYGSVSLDGNYFAGQEFTITADNQVVDYQLTHLEDDVALAYATAPTGTFSLAPNLNVTCAIKLTGEELADLSHDALAEVRFRAPLGSDQGDYWGQIWWGNQLISEVPIPNVVSGDWTEAVLPVFAEIYPDESYYVGYRLVSDTGVYAWHDAGPHVAGKGGFFRTGGWVELPASSDYNFCIEAVAVSNNAGVISGHVTLNGGSGAVSNTAIRAGMYAARPDYTGAYALPAVPGTYDVVATLNGYDPVTVGSVTVTLDGVTGNVDFTLNSNGSAVHDDAVAWNGGVVAYPNPFNPTTTFSFSLPQPGAVTVEIYDVRGRKVRTLVDESLQAGDHSIVWNGDNDEGQTLASGVYLFKVGSGKVTSSGKVVLLK